MKKYILMSIIALFVANMGYAIEDDNNKLNKEASVSKDCAIQGFVVDKDTNERLAGVEITVEGTSISALSDLDGRFVIVGLPEGDYNLKVSYISYQDTQIKDLAAKSNANLKPVQLSLEAE